MVLIFFQTYSISQGQLDYQLILQKGHAKQFSFTTQMLTNLAEYGMIMPNVI